MVSPLSCDFSVLKGKVSTTSGIHLALVLMTFLIWNVVLLFFAVSVVVCLPLACLPFLEVPFGIDLN